MEENKDEMTIITQEINLQNTHKEFVKPKWMNLLAEILEQKSLTKTIKSLNA